MLAECWVTRPPSDGRDMEMGAHNTNSVQPFRGMLRRGKGFWHLTFNISFKLLTFFCEFLLFYI